MKSLMVLATVCLSFGAQAEKWNRANDPANFDIQINGKLGQVFARLPLSAKLKDERYGWSESYWPSMLGGIAYRWNHPNPQPFTFRSPSKEEVLRMSEEELSQLSPSELYDISQGDYKYSLTKKVLRTYNPKDLWWEGICHGWSLAAIHYPEPAKTIVMSKDGVRVPFGSSDVKALLSMHDAYNSRGIYSRVGNRCKVPGKVPGEAWPEDIANGTGNYPSERDANSSNCKDVNAGAFHVVLTNMIGIHSMGFIADVDRFNDVWNQPVVSYESKIMGEVPVTSAEMREGVRRKLRMATTMVYGDELEFYSEESAHEGVLGFVSKDPVTGTPAQTFAEKNYEYILELDGSGNIIGGEWITLTRPDFLWMKAKDTSFHDGRFPLSGLNRIYRPIQKR